MRTVDIHEAKTHLSRLVDQAARGESFVIAKAGKPRVNVTHLEPTEVKQRIGFMAGEFAVPDDFDDMEGAENRTTFPGPELKRRLTQAHTEAMALLAAAQKLAKHAGSVVSHFEFPLLVQPRHGGECRRRLLCA
jgi:prevent-host-death family protein